MRDLVVEGDTLAIVMDLVEGGDLRGLSGPRTLPPRPGLPSSAPASLQAWPRSMLAGVIHGRQARERSSSTPHPIPGPTTADGFRHRQVGCPVGRHGRAKHHAIVGTPQYIAPGTHRRQRSRRLPLTCTRWESCCQRACLRRDAFRWRLDSRRLCATMRNAHPGRPAGVPDSLWDLISWLLGKHAAARPSRRARSPLFLDALVPELVGPCRPPKRSKSLPSLSRPCHPDD